MPEIRNEHDENGVDFETACQHFKRQQNFFRYPKIQGENIHACLLRSEHDARVCQAGK